MTQPTVAATIIALCCGLVGCASRDSSSVQQTIEEYPALANIKKIYIASLGNEEGAGLVRERIRLRLAKSMRMSVVENPDQADAALMGVAGVETTYSGSGGNLRMRRSGAAALRLVNVKTRDTVWTYEYEGGYGGPQFRASSGVSSVANGIADRMVDKLLKDAGYADRKK